MNNSFTLSKGLDKKFNLPVPDNDDMIKIDMESEIMKSKVLDVYEMIIYCNKINEGEDGIGTEDDTVDLNDINKIKYLKIIPEFQIMDDKISLNIVHCSLNTNGKSIVVLPGFSKKSICWTIGRMNQFRQILKEKGYKDVYIFDFQNVKPLMKKHSEALKDQIFYNNFIKNIAKIVDKIIRGIILKNNEMISVIGRSAGGGVSIFLYELETCNYIDGLNLAAPGYDPNGLNEKFLNKAKEKQLNVRLSHHIDDQKVPASEINNMNEKLQNINLNNYKFIRIENKELTREAQQHRIHNELIEDMV